MMTDPIADMLTRIRNAGMVRKASVDIPYSRLKEEIARVLKEEGFILGYEVLQEEGRPHRTLRVFLKYDKNRQHVIRGLQRVSKPGRRIYTRARELPRVRAGLGIAILSTPKGVLSDYQAFLENVGGEVLCYVW